MMLQKESNEFEDINSICKHTFDLLTVENKRLNDDFIKHHESVDDEEQRNRNLCLLMHGVEENADEKTDDLVLSVINKDLGNMRLDDRERSHRLGPFNNRQNLRSTKNISRPIIIRFNSFRKDKRCLKRKAI